MDVPFSVADAVEAELVCDFGDGHGVGKVLLVCKDEEDGITKLVLVEHAVEFVVGIGNAVTIVRVDDEDQPLRVRVVVAPQRTDLVLATDIPHREVDVLVFYGLDVKPNRRNRRHNLAKLQLVENRRLTRRVQTNHQNTNLLLAEKAVEKLRKCKTHRCSIDSEYRNRNKKQQKKRKRKRKKRKEENGKWKVNGKKE